MKSKRLVSSLAVKLAMATILALSLGTPASLNSAQKKTSETHPEIRSAINSLQKAKAHLTLANHDFGGHRDDAVKACDEAIKQLNEAMKFDKD